MALGKLVTMNSVNKLAIIGTRLTVVDYSPAYDLNKEAQTNAYPLSAQIDKNRS